MSLLGTGVGIGVGLVCLLVAGLIWTGPRHPYTHLAAAGLALTGSCGLIAAPHLGAFLRWAVNGIFGLLNFAGGQLIGFGLGTVLAIYVAWRFCEPVVVHIKNACRTPMPEHTLTYAVALPLTAAAIPGVLGDWITTGIGWVAHLLARGIGLLFGF